VLHLIHPAIVHLTIVFLVVGGSVEAVGLLARLERAERFGSLLGLLGIASLVPTIAAGYLAQNTIAVGEAASPWMLRHERFALILLGVNLALLVVRAWGRGRIPEGGRVAYATGLLAAVILAVATAYVGGTMVYGFGVGVAR
jgi:uncharacterized membrane protein